MLAFEELPLKSDEEDRSLLAVASGFWAAWLATDAGGVFEVAYQILLLRLPEVAFESLEDLNDSAYVLAACYC